MPARVKSVFLPACVTGLALAAVPRVAWAQESTLDSGDTAWMLVSCALVMLMTPGLALFYGGLVRAKNVLNTMMLSMIALGVMTIQWVVVGYSLSFGSDMGGFVGNPGEFFLFRGVGVEPAPGAATIPHMVFAMFQGMFAIITPALISGAIAERMKFKAYVLFIVLWGTLVYDPLCHWVWGGGWLTGEALDFAGGTVVHVSAGVSALVGAIVVGQRVGYHKEALPPHSLVISGVGAGLLWFGWFGFNAGSALASNASAALALTNTHIAAGSAVAVWALAEAMHRGKASALGVVSGLVAGLVAITPAAGFVGPVAAIAIGGIAAVVCYSAVVFKESKQYDDSLDAFGIHGVGGAVGALLTGVFAREMWGGKSGLLEGNTMQFLHQITGVVATIVYAGGMTFVLLFVCRVVCGGLRVTPESELGGLDLAEHGESGYII